MSHVGSVRIGPIEVTTICEGFAPIALDEELPGTQVDWAAERRRHPWAFVGEAAWPWHVHAFVLRTPAGIVVVDSGLGPFPPYRAWDAHDEHAWDDVDTGEVAHVVLTHLHSDHAGGVVPDAEPRFAGALHHVHPSDWAYFAERDETEEYTARHRMQVLEDRGMLRLNGTDHQIVPGVALRHSPGHTPGHRSVLVGDREDHLLITGDLLHLPVQAAMPDRPSSHDVDPLLGIASRRVFLFAAADEGWRVAAGHFAEPFGTVTTAGWTGTSDPSMG
jgi:glyoxylase-like metal-dependent hydrolase (beta-lactamase superfamily II)